MRRYRIGFVGAGYIADWHAEAVAAIPGVELVAVCDRDADRAQRFSARHKVVHCFNGIDEMLSSQKLDAVHVLVPPDSHRAVAESALNAGCNVLVEKPMCANSGDCRSLAGLAQRRSLALAVNHNFLFSGVYEQLKRDLATGKLGRLLQIIIVWNKELPQLQSGPFGIWMFREPANMMLELGSHSVAHMFDLAGVPDEIEASAFDPVVLPGNRAIYRRWEVQAHKGETSITLCYSFRFGFPEHYIRVRGTTGVAMVDFDRNTYTVSRRTKYSLDFDRYFLVSSEAASLQRQARRTLLGYVYGKLKSSVAGKPYGESIYHSVRCFYQQIPQITDDRISPRLGSDVVALCEKIAANAGLAPCKEKTPAASPPSAPSSSPNVLVFGGTGFIGKHLVKELVRNGHNVRMLARNPNSIPDDLRNAQVEVVPGNMANPADLERALRGIQYVYHLARALVETREEYFEQDVTPTGKIAEACLAGKVRRLIYTSSIDSYYAGSPGSVVTEETPLDPRIRRRNDYAWAKAESEKMLLSMHREKGLPVIIFRPGIVIGPGGSPFHWGIGMWSWGSVCRCWGKGTNPLPLVLVEDVAKALVAALTPQGIEGQSFNLIDVPCVTAREYVQEMCRASGTQFDCEPTAIWRFYVADMLKWFVKCMIRHPGRRLPSYHDWESRTQQAIFDCTKAREVLGWRPASERVRLIREGIHLPTVEFFA